MAQILCLATGLTGMLHATFEVVRRLEGAGHSVTLACSWEKAADAVRRQGIRHLQLDPVEFQPTSVDDLGMDAFGRLLDDERPDLVLADIEMADHILTCLSREIPLGLLSPWFCFTKRRGLPPLHRRTIPGVGWRGSRFAIEWQWRRFLRRRKARQKTQHRTHVLLEYARSLGVSVDELDVLSFVNPFSYRTLPILSLTASEMEFPHDPQPNLHYVGPMVAAHRVEDHADSVARAAGILAKAEGPVITVGRSSMAAGDLEFVQKLVEAVRGRRDWTVILGLGSRIDLQQLGDLPPNTHAFEWLPQIQVLAGASCSLNHGGIHTIHENLHFRVPMVVHSDHQNDQDGCAARIHYHRLGLSQEKRGAQVADITKAIEEVLTNREVKERVDAMQSTIDGYSSRRVLESTVERILNGLDLASRNSDS